MKRAVEHVTGMVVRYLFILTDEVPNYPAFILSDFCSTYMGSLVCCQHFSDETAPGCSGERLSNTDYCCDRPPNMIMSAVDYDGWPCTIFLYQSS